MAGKAHAPDLFLEPFLLWPALASLPVLADCCCRYQTAAMGSYQTLDLIDTFLNYQVHLFEPAVSLRLCCLHGPSPSTLEVMLVANQDGRRLGAGRAGGR